MCSNNSASIHRRCIEEQLNDLDTFTVSFLDVLPIQRSSSKHLNSSQTGSRVVPNQIPPSGSSSIQHFQIAAAAQERQKRSLTVLKPELRGSHSSLDSEFWRMNSVSPSPLTTSTSNSLSQPSPPTSCRNSLDSYPMQSSFSSLDPIGTPVKTSRDPSPSSMYLQRNSSPHMWNDSTNNIYQVQLKHNFKDCTLATTAAGIPIELGSFVIIASDNGGYDLGIVTCVSTLDAFARRRATVGMSKDSEENNIGTILRIATVTERQQLPTKREREDAILPIILDKVHNKYCLPMEVKGAEFQFDGRKLTIHFTSDVRIDFRELVRDFNNTFKTRVWMKKINQCSPFHPKPFATVALATGCVFNHLSAAVNNNNSNINNNNMHMHMNGMNMHNNNNNMM